MKVGIIGASGYTGAELLRLLAGHGEAEVGYITANTYSATRVSSLYPHLAAYDDLTFGDFDLDTATASADLFFVALPHSKSMEVVPALYAAGAKVIDLSADYRLNTPESYEQWYGNAHTSPDLLSTAVYGLPEFFREDIKSASLIAVPGCYPTAVMLAVAPLLKAGIISKQGLIADAKSGVSGAGRSLSLTTHFAQCNESVGPYNVGVHRHTPEIHLYLSRLAGSTVSLLFAPHLVPMNRGILATCYGHLSGEASTADLLKACQDFYAASPFVVVLPTGEYPQTKNVQGSNYCHLGVMADGTTNTAVAMCAIDNLVKGASGAAVQCMNLMLGYPEDEGLTGLPLFP